jgi:hypothetical protein
MEQDDQRYGNTAQAIELDDSRTYPRMRASTQK